MGIERIKQYLVKVKNVSPLRIGSGDEEALLIVDGHALISGTSIAGAFKNKTTIFEEEEGQISNMFFYDAFSVEAVNSQELQERNHVKIDYEYGVSCDEALFSQYHISGEKTFHMTFEVRENNIDKSKYKYEELCNELERLIGMLAQGNISLGSNKTFGFGKFQSVDNKIYEREFDLSTKEGLDLYLKSYLIKEEDMTAKELKGNKAEVINIKMQAYCEDGFIIKGNKEKEITNSCKELEVMNSYKELGKYIISASTIKGVIRGYINKIFNTVEIFGITEDEMFGARKNKESEKKTDGKESDNKEKKQIGKLIFKDITIKKAKEEEVIYNRIKVDRFTGGEMKGSLRSEKAVLISKENPIEIEITINEKNEKMLALILLSLRDIGLGLVSIGSGSSVGLGRFTGKNITIEGLAEKNYSINFNGNEIYGDLDKFEEIVSKIAAK